MKSFQLISMATLLGTPFAASITNGPCSLDRVRNCTDAFYMMQKVGHRSIVPEGEGALLEYCEKQRAAESCLRERATRCDSGLIKGLSRVLFDDNREEISRRCDPTSEEHRAFLSAAPCLNTVGDEMYNCSAHMMIRLMSIDDATTFREKSKLGCCLYQNFEKCVLAATAKRCGTKVRNFLDGYLQVTARETFDLLCASGQDACSDMKPVVPRKDLNLDTDGPQNIFEGVHYILERVQTKN